MEEKTPAQLKAIEEIRKPQHFPIWIIFVLIVLLFLVFWYLSRSSYGTKSTSPVLKDNTTSITLASPNSKDLRIHKSLKSDVQHLSPAVSQSF